MLSKSKIQNCLLSVLSKCDTYYSKDIQLIQLKNKYGINPLIYKVTFNKTDYFVKVTPVNNTKSLDNKISSFLPTPKKILNIVYENNNIEIYEFIDGVLFTDLTFSAEKDNDYGRCLQFENAKNKQLATLYTKTLKMRKCEEIYTSRPETLYKHRLLGKRYLDYYNTKYFETIFNKKLVLNGRIFESPNFYIDKTAKLYSKVQTYNKVPVILGHGDAHQQNVIISKNNSVFFIDDEYSDYIPINMELGKPYYIDLFGTLFFFFNDTLLKYFDIKPFTVVNDLLYLNIKVKKLPELRIKLTENKIKHFQNLLQNFNGDFRLNDYLLMSHILSRNPISYKTEIIPLFLALIPVLSIFDPLKPRELFKYFE